MTFSFLENLSFRIARAHQPISTTQSPLTHVTINPSLTLQGVLHTTTDLNPKPNNTRRKLENYIQQRTVMVAHKSRERHETHR